MSKELDHIYAQYADKCREMQALQGKNAQLEAQVDALSKKLALLFDQSTYSDSYGVEGSSFSVCRWCGGGSGPGGNPGFKHNEGCLFDDDALEKQVAEVWDKDTASECLELHAQVAALSRPLDFHALPAHMRSTDPIGNAGEIEYAEPPKDRP